MGDSTFPSCSRYSTPSSACRRLDQQCPAAGAPAGAVRSHRAARGARSGAGVAAPVTPTYLAFLGRIAPEKGPESQQFVSRVRGIPLKIAAKVDKADQQYFDAMIRPMLDSPGVEMIGEISEREKPAFLSGAMALLMPIDWPEPFGLVMIEAMSCGTPVIAFNRGSVPEVVERIDRLHRGGRSGRRRGCQVSRSSGPWCECARFEQRFHGALEWREDLLATYSSLAAKYGPSAAAAAGRQERRALEFSHVVTVAVMVTALRDKLGPPQLAHVCSSWAATTGMVRRRTKAGRGRSYDLHRCAAGAARARGQ